MQTKIEPIDYFLIPIIILIFISIRLYNFGILNVVICILLFWNTCWLVYNKFIRTQFKDPINGDPLSVFKIDLPKRLKGHIRNVSKSPEMNNPDDESVNGWTLGHIAIYLTLGLFVSNSYTFVILISLFNELWEYYAGWRARWFLDPVTNMFGYCLGRFLIHMNIFPLLSKNKGLELHIVTKNIPSYVLTIVLGFLLLLSIQLNTKVMPKII